MIRLGRGWQYYLLNLCEKCQCYRHRAGPCPSPLYYGNGAENHDITAYQVLTSSVK